MAVSLAYLLDRILHDKARAQDLHALRQRLDRQLPASHVSYEEEIAARELRELRVAILDALGQVQSCRTCARGHPYPHGRWDGGHCCGGVTEHLFTNDEVAALRAAGTRARHLRPPRSDHAGCAFRGPRGCSLAAEHRPNLCVRYTCPELRSELRARGDLGKIDKLCDRMLIVFKQFVEAKEQRSNDDVFRELLSSEASTRTRR